MTKRVHRIGGLPPFEVSSKPWFGPTQRAAKFLTAGRPALEPSKALEGLHRVLGSDFAGIQHVRFIDCVRRDKANTRFTIALCWTKDDPRLRDRLYELAEEIVGQTGWYPLPQGSRLGSVRESAAMRLHSADIDVRGVPAAVRAAVPPEGGCSIRIMMTSGASLLLDTGLPGHLDVREDDVAAFVSHAHLDHAGGIVSGALPVDVPLVVGHTTLRLLDQRELLADRSMHQVTANQVVPLGDESELEPFSVPHLPGALGCVVRGGGRSVIFTGDICLRTSRHDFTTTLTEVVEAETSRPTVLLDATMAGREFGAGIQPVAEQALAALDRDLVIVGVEGEQLLYSYLDLFHTVQRGDQRHSTSFIVSSRLRPMFQLLHSAFVRRAQAELDPFIIGQYGATMSAWGESRWLYWLDHLRTVPDGRRIWFVVPGELERLGVEGDVTFVEVGRGDSGEVARRLGWNELSGCDVSAWSLHSDEQTLAEGIVRLTAAGARVVLFHNFGKRLKKWARERRLDVDVLSSTADLRL